PRPPGPALAPPDDDGDTPLHTAAAAGAPHAAAFLLAQGAAVNEARRGRTPLALALERGRGGGAGGRARRETSGAAGGPRWRSHSSGAASRWRASCCSRAPTRWRRSDRSAARPFGPPGRRATG